MSTIGCMPDRPSWDARFNDEETQALAVVRQRLWPIPDKLSRSGKAISKVILAGHQPAPPSTCQATPVETPAQRYTQASRQSSLYGSLHPAAFAELLVSMKVMADVAPQIEDVTLDHLIGALLTMGDHRRSISEIGDIGRKIVGLFVERLFRSGSDEAIRSLVQRALVPVEDDSSCHLLQSYGLAYVATLLEKRIPSDCVESLYSALMALPSKGTNRAPLLAALAPHFSEQRLAQALKVACQERNVMCAALIAARMEPKQVKKVEVEWPYLRDMAHTQDAEKLVTRILKTSVAWEGTAAHVGMLVALRSRSNQQVEICDRLVDSCLNMPRTDIEPVINALTQSMNIAIARSDRLVHIADELAPNHYRYLSYTDHPTQRLGQRLLLSMVEYLRQPNVVFTVQPELWAKLWVSIFYACQQTRWGDGAKALCEITKQLSPEQKLQMLRLVTGEDKLPADSLFWRYPAIYGGRPAQAVGVTALVDVIRPPHQGSELSDPGVLIELLYLQKHPDAEVRRAAGEAFAALEPRCARQALWAEAQLCADRNYVYDKHHEPCGGEESAKAGKLMLKHLVESASIAEIQTYASP